MTGERNAKKMKRRLAAAVASLAMLISGLSMSSAHADYILPSIENDEGYQTNLNNLVKSCDEVPELLEDFKRCVKFGGRDEIYRLFLQESGDGYSMYSFVRYFSKDSGTIIISTKSEIELDLSELLKKIDCPDNLLEIESNFYEESRWRDAYQIISISFLDFDHDLNFEILMKLFALLQKDYEIESANMRLDSRKFNYDIKIDWTEMERIDQYGLAASLYEELSSKEIAALNEEFAEMGFKVQCNPETGKMIYDKAMTEAERFEFAVYFYDNYGFYVTARETNMMTGGFFESTIDLLSPIKSFQRNGDSNGDGETDIADAVLIMQSITNPDKYKLTEDGIFNADVYDTGDGVTNMDSLQIQKWLIGSFD